MKANDLGELEILSRCPEGGASRPRPLLFVHGAYTGAWCWDEHFLAYFAGRGYDARAVSLSGHGGSRDRRLLDSYSIDDYVGDVAQAVGEMPASPVLIGHSMGGLVVQKYQELERSPAVVLLSSVPPQGLFASALGLAFRKPALMADLNRLLGGGRVDIEGLRAALFHQPVSAGDLRRFLRASQPESHRAIWDMTLFNLPDPACMAGVPLLVVGAEHDELMPPSQVELTARSYGVEAEILPDLGHALMLEQGWESVAQRIAKWLESHKL